MKKAGNNRGFTLIELLVVVLIIGILAAVAVPQYQKAVVKARTSAFLPLAKSLLDAEESYFLANGEYTLDVLNLDIQMPADCTPASQNNQQWKCGNNFLIDVSVPPGAGGIMVNYCPNANTNYATCSSVRDFEIILGVSFPDDDQISPQERTCKPFNGSKLGAAICSAFGEFEYKQ